MGYEYLITGLDELSLDSKSKLSFDDLLSLLKEQMSESDFAFITLLQTRTSDPEIVALLDDDAQLDRFHETALSKEDFLTQLVYEKGMKCRNKFLRRWFEFNLNLNNVLAAAICRRHGYDIQKVVVGENEVAQTLRNNGISKNQNLAALLPELKQIIQVAEIENLLDREKHIDALRWQWIDEAVLFKYFELDNVLAYYIKAEILHRWDDLTQEQGEKVFRALIAEMKKDIHFE